MASPPLPNPEGSLAQEATLKATIPRKSEDEETLLEGSRERRLGSAIRTDDDSSRRVKGDRLEELLRDDVFAHARPTEAAERDNNNEAATETGAARTTVQTDDDSRPPLLATASGKGGRPAEGSASSAANRDDSDDDAKGQVARETGHESRGALTEKPSRTQTIASDATVEPAGGAGTDYNNKEQSKAMQVSKNILDGLRTVSISDATSSRPLSPPSLPSQRLADRLRYQCTARDFAKWSLSFGGFDLAIGLATPAVSAATCEIIESVSEAEGTDWVGRSVWAVAAGSGAEQLVRKAASEASKSAATRIAIWVPVRPKEKWWVEARARFEVVESIEQGRKHLIGDGSNEERLQLLEPLELWWRQPEEKKFATHFRYLQRQQAKKLTQDNQARRRVDATTYDLWTRRHRQAGPPTACDPRAMMMNDPTRRHELDSSLGAVESPLNPAAWEMYHLRHCKTCGSKGEVVEHCYFHRMLHHIRYGYPLHQAACGSIGTDLIDNYKTIEEEHESVCAYLDKCEDLGAVSELVALPEGAGTLPLSCVVRDKDRRKSRLTNKPLKIRVVADYSRQVNDALDKWKFKYEGVDAAAELVTPGCWLATVDISKFFLRVPLHKAAYKTSFFRDPRAAGEKVYRHFKSLMFGSKLAPAFCSAISAEALTILRHEVASRSSAFVDDFILAAEQRWNCERQQKGSMRILKELGLDVAADKTEPPSQRLTYLGVVFDTVKGELSVDLESFTMLEAKSTVDRVLAGGRSSALTRTELRRLVGQLSWAAQTMHGGRPHMRRLWDGLKGKPQRKTYLPRRSLEDLTYWKERLQDPDWKGSKLLYQEHEWPVIIMKSDASGTDGAGYHFGNTEHMYVWKRWQQQKRSIQWKELHPIIVAARRHGEEWRGRIIRFGVDNQSVVYMVNSGKSKCDHCQSLLRELSELERRFKFRSLSSWVPREFNVTSDLLSRQIAICDQPKL